MSYSGQTGQDPAAGPGPDVILFDLGGVLMNFGGHQRLAELSGIDQGTTLRARWTSSGWVQAFERGACTAEEFAQGVVNDLDLDLTPAAFLNDFGSWSAGPFAGSPELVRSLYGRIRMGCLSNTNSVHWQRHLDHWGIVQYFDWTFTSHELGMMKPDPAVFRHVIRTIGTTPGRLLFLDDVDENVQAARALGMRAEQTQGVHEVENALRSHLPADSAAGRTLRPSATRRPADRLGRVHRARARFGQVMPTRPVGNSDHWTEHAAPIRSPNPTRCNFTTSYGGLVNRKLIATASALAVGVGVLGGAAAAHASTYPVVAKATWVNDTLSVTYTQMTTPGNGEDEQMQVVVDGKVVYDPIDLRQARSAPSG